MQRVVLRVETHGQLLPALDLKPTKKYEENIDASLVMIPAIPGKASFLI